LLLLPEAPWKSYGDRKKTLNQNGLTELLQEYGLEYDRARNKQGKRIRGLLYKRFHEQYCRYSRVGDPTLKSVIEELSRDSDPDSPSGGSPTSPPTNPQAPSSGGKEKGQLK
jgi:hypothetical protein